MPSPDVEQQPAAPESRAEATRDAGAEANMSGAADLTNPANQSDYLNMRDANVSGVANNDEAARMLGSAGDVTIGGTPPGGTPSAREGDPPGPTDTRPREGAEPVPNQPERAGGQLQNGDGTPHQTHEGAMDHQPPSGRQPIGGDVKQELGSKPNPQALGDGQHSSQVQQTLPHLNPHAVPQTLDGKKPIRQ